MIRFCYIFGTSWVSVKNWHVGDGGFPQILGKLKEKYVILFYMSYQCLYFSLLLVKRR